MKHDFGMIGGQISLASLTSEIAAIAAEASSSLEKDRPMASVLTSYGQSESHAQDGMGASDYSVAFSGISKQFCVGVVDLVGSTITSANLNEKQWCKYYAIFLNSMSSILKKFGGAAIKNGGDSLFYYFPETDSHESKAFAKSIECGIAMIEAHDVICATVRNEGLPALNYRVSQDYGKVVLMQANTSSCIDLIGPPVNMCAKINHMAKTNGMVIGGDLYQVVKSLAGYKMKEKGGISIGLRQTYPIYSVSRGNHAHFV